MDRLNYFNPYQSKESHHEDQLTRAYLTLLKHSFHAFSTFYEYCNVNHKIDNEKLEERIPLYELIDQGWEIATQKGNPFIKTDWLMSVLITDIHLDDNYSEIEKSDRNARYDGVISFGNKLTLIIEVKPRFNNVWYGQLRPSKQKLTEETKIYSSPVVLEWKAIINQLNRILSAQSLPRFEKTMIEDFLAFIDENFPFLNPYDTLHLCKNNHELIYRRIKNILTELVKDESIIKYHQGWGFYIQTPYNEIRQIGLIFVPGQGNNWSLELSLYFGASQSQAKSFYKKKPSIDKVKFDSWSVFGNFHVSFVTSNLVWLPSPDADSYLKYWIKNEPLIRQQSRENVPVFLNKLVSDGILTIGKEQEDQLDKRFYNTAMQSLNMVPEFGVLYSLNANEAEQLDKDSQLINLLKKKIKDGLSIIGKNGSEFINL